MSTQYNSISDPYYSIRHSTLAYIEQANVDEIIAPLVQSQKVLDLACGAGFYSYKYLEWGASHVLGIDISPAQISKARTMKPAHIPNPPTFAVADCTHLTLYPGAPYPLIHASWLLNYSPTLSSLISTFRTVALNLAPGGTFITILKPPTDDPAALVERERALRPMEKGGSGGLVCHVVGEMEGGVGVKLDVRARKGEDEVGFECFYHRREVVERAAREGGLRGRLRWVGMRVPGEFLEGVRDGGVRGGASREEVESYGVVSHYAVLVVEKGGEGEGEGVE
ncbi:hypothetical protein ACLMJK_007054 [Lecanora helva]